MTHSQKMKEVIETPPKLYATFWLDKFRNIREGEGPQRVSSVLPSHDTQKRR